MTNVNSFGVKLIPKNIYYFTGNRNSEANTSRIQVYDEKMCGYFCNRFHQMGV